MTDHVPPVDPCMWRVTDENVIGYTDSGEKVCGVRGVYIVGPCKTAYDAWKMSGLPGDFGAYEYEPVRKDEK